MIGLIVDGEGDFSAFRARYSGRARVFKTDGPRGDTVSAREIVESARKQIAQLKSLGCRRIAIVTDFESRHGTAEAFMTTCLSHARTLDFASDLLVFVADRMLENWLLADICSLASRKRYLRKISRQRNFESTNGKIELKKLFKNGYDYNEVRHCQELFPLVDGDKAATFSASFAHFRSSLGLD